MAITKYTATYSDGSSADFMTLEDLISHDAQPALHPDAALAAPAAPEAPAPEVPAEPNTTATPDEPTPPTE